MSFLYQTPTAEATGPLSPLTSLPSRYNPVVANLPLETAAATAKDAAVSSTLSHTPFSGQSFVDQSPNLHHLSFDSMPPPMTTKVPNAPDNPASAAEADLLLGLHGPDGINSARDMSSEGSSFDKAVSSSQPPAGPPQHTFDYPPAVANQVSATSNPIDPPGPGGSIAAPLHDMMMIESQDIDTSAPQGVSAFPGVDMIPWLEYLPQDILNYFGDPPDDGSMMNPAGPGPPLAPSSRPPNCD